jgi:hypothetical protein
MKQITIPKRYLLVFLGIAIPLFFLVLYLYLLSPHGLATVEIVPSQTGKPERCLTCHTGIESIGTSHPTQQFGCVSCHGGQALATDKETAHIGITRNPGDLSVADKYCGSCHAAQTALVPRNIMSTYSGAITLIRRAYGQQSDDQAQYATTDIGSLHAFHTSPSDPVPVQHFSSNCLSCHLRTTSIQQPYFYRSTGCSACHVPYNNDGLYKGGDPTIPKNVAGYPTMHEITKQIPYTQCNHCHNRGNYDLASMTFLPRNDLPAPAGLSDAQLRLYDYYQPIGKFSKCEFELDCIDCHTKNEIMGDGTLHNNKAEQQYIQCSTCHGTKDTLPSWVSVQDALANLSPSTTIRVGASAIMQTERGELLQNIQRVRGQWVLTTKVDGISYVVPMVKGSLCQQKPDQQASQDCHQCHVASRMNHPAATATP